MHERAQVCVCAHCKKSNLVRQPDDRDYVWVASQPIQRLALLRVTARGRRLRNAAKKIM